MRKALAVLVLLAACGDDDKEAIPPPSDELTVEGTFTLDDPDSAGPSDGAACKGEGFYADLSESTPVVVVNDSGETLDRTQLGPGETEGSLACRFVFQFEVTEGEDSYIVQIGDRGELSYTFEELQEPNAVQMSAGG